MQDGDEVGVAAHELHVVLDDDDGAVGDDPLEQVAGLLALLGAHAGDRLVEEHHPRVLHQQHPDLEPLPLPVGQEPRRPVRQCGEADRLQRLLDALGDLAAGEQQPAVLRCMPAAMSRFCSTLSCSNTVAVWNVRPMPRRTIWCDFIVSRSLSRNSARPVPWTSPVRASTTVVLPAHFQAVG